MNNTYNISEFLKYLHIDGYKDDSMMVIHYDDQHTEAEEILLKDIFEKAYSEYHKDRLSMDVLAAYARLILSYVNAFYERQFETRSKLYNEIVTDFYQNLETYYDDRREVVELPNVAYFADKSNHSPNYFGDVIKHFTGSSPSELIHDHVLATARKKLLDNHLTINQIAYSLGFIKRRLELARANW